MHLMKQNLNIALMLVIEPAEFNSNTRLITTHHSHKFATAFGVAVIVAIKEHFKLGPNR
jgi:hypothetical protein